MGGGAPGASTLARFVPRTVLRALEQGLPACPSAESHHGAILFADLSGFTELAERLAHGDGGGSEELSRVLNSHLEPLIELVERWGGDVLKFAGDALLALWTVPAGDLRQPVQSAARCALAMQRRSGPQGNGEDLALRIGVAAGDVVLMHLSSTDDHREIMVAGGALVQLTSLQGLIGPGDVVLTNPAWGCLRDEAGGAPLQNGAVRLDRLDAEDSPVHRHQPSLQPRGADEDALRPYVPTTIFPRLIAGHSEWLAEIRRLSVLFIKLPGLSHTVGPDFAQRMLSTILAAAARYGGVISGISSDDKGISILVAFGLPPMAHEDDPVRALNAAMAVQAGLHENGLLGAIGAASGTAFCGLLGSGRRVQYTVLGDVVNRASRLMTACSDGVLCDRSTHTAAGARFRFRAYPPIQVKGNSRLLEVFQPLESIGATRLPAQSLVGRTSETAVLHERVARLEERGEGGLLLVEGEAGIGKSRLVEHVCGAARSDGVAVLQAAADAMDAGTPFHAWRAILSQLLGLEQLHDEPAVRRGRVFRILEGDAGVHRLAPLLNPLLGLDFPETPFTRQMDPEIRARSTENLLLHVLERSLTRPTLIVLEDVHWLDSASWRLTRQAVQQSRPLLLVMTARPGDVREGVQQLVEPGGVLMLGPLSRSETGRLLEQRLGRERVSERLLDLIHSRAEGNPFFAEQLAQALEDGDLVGALSEEGEGSAEPGAPEVVLPESVQGVIVSRIDRLPPDPQLCLKVASVIGRAFPVAALAAVHPLGEPVEAIQDHLRHLQSRHLVEPDTAAGEAGYRFQHAITQEATYQLLPLRQRQQIHKALAEWYETEYAAEPARYYPTLVHHWRRAGAEQTLLRYLDLAGAEALASGAYREAIEYFKEAQQRTEPDPATPDPPVDIQRALRERKIAEAQYGLGRLAESRQSLKRVLAVLDRPLPESNGHLLARVAREAGLQLMHRLGGLRLARTRRSRAALVEAGLAYERLAELAFFLEENVQVLYAVLRGLNIAERAETPAQLARSCAHMSALLDIIPARPVARFYEKRALELADAADQIAARAHVYQAIGLSSIGLGIWSKAEEFVTRAADLFHGLGHRRKWIESQSLAMDIAFHTGRYDRVEQQLPDLLKIASRSGGAQAERWILHNTARQAMVRGRFHEALAAIDRAIELEAGRVDPADEVRFHSLKALALLRVKDFAAAERAAGEGMTRIGSIQSLAFYTCAGFSELAEVQLALAALGEGRTELGPSELRRRASVACGRLGRYARLFPMARPSSARVAGLVLWARGRPRRAVRAWRKSLAAAEKLDMPHDQGLAHLTLGVHAPPGETSSSHLEAACRIFADLGAAHSHACARTGLQSCDDQLRSLRASPPT